MTPEQARGAGARSMVIGVANPGGLIPDGWLPGLLQALAAGLDLIGGMHARLHEIAVLRAAAERLGRPLVAVPQPPRDIPVEIARAPSRARVCQYVHVSLAAVSLQKTFVLFFILFSFL